MSSEMSSKEPAQPIWSRPAPGERKPTLSRERIVETALRVADAEGFEAVSMRRIASELGAGTMTLYHYVKTKDELVALIGDAIMGELLIPATEVPDGWREGMAEIARRTRGVFNRHPWILEHIDEQSDHGAGPNMLHHIEQSIAVAADTGLDVDGQLELSALVDDYVFGHVMRAREGFHFSDDDPAAKRRLEAMLAYVQTQLATGEFPHLAALVGDDPRGALLRRAEQAIDEQRFERGLQILLDGIELDLERRRARVSE
jgi:AcrR family transcriptional regulator